jgi:hypothetical protein
MLIGYAFVIVVKRRWFLEKVLGLIVLAVAAVSEIYDEPMPIHKKLAANQS